MFRHVSKFSLSFWRKTLICYQFIKVKCLKVEPNLDFRALVWKDMAQNPTVEVYHFFCERIAKLSNLKLLMTDLAQFVQCGAS